MSEEKRCYICNRPAEIWWWQEHAGNEVRCDYCGYYRIGNLAEKAMRDQWASGELDPLLWYLPAATRQATEPPTITSDNWREMAKPHAERSHEERARKVLALLKQRSSFRGESVAFEHDKDKPHVDIGRDEEADFVLRELTDAGLIEGQYPLFRVTPKGWALRVAGGAKAAVQHVFLSHAALDAQLAAALADEMRNRLPKAEVFVASQPGQIRTGDKWLEAVEQRLEDDDTYVILLTPQSIERRWVWFETGSIWFNDAKRILPVTADGLDEGKIPHPLSVRQALNLQKPAHVQQFFRDLGVEISDAEAQEIVQRLGDRSVGGGVGPVL